MNSIYEIPLIRCFLNPFLCGERNVSEFQFQMIQLAERSFEALKGTPAGILFLRVMKAERLDQLLGEEVWDELLLLQITQETFELLLRYILSAGIDKEAFETKVKSIRDAETRLKVMTLAQQYHQEGRTEGRKEGVLTSRRQAVVEALEIRFGSVPDWILAELNAVVEDEKLKILHRSAIQSVTLDAFVQTL